MKRYLILILCLTAVVVVMAQQITGRAPSQVAVGEQFRLSYTVNTDDVCVDGTKYLYTIQLSIGKWTHVQFVISHLYLYLISQ